MLDAGLLTSGRAVVLYCTIQLQRNEILETDPVRYKGSAPGRRARIEVIISPPTQSLAANPIRSVRKTGQPQRPSLMSAGSGRQIWKPDRLQEKVMGKVSIWNVADMKARGEKIPMITVYDYTTA